VIFVGHAGPEAFPLDRQQQAQSVVEPVDFGGPRHDDSDQDDAEHPVRVALGVGQDQG
jgi:hypothetical protein